MGIGFRLKEAREKAHLTQEELGKMVGVTGSAITNYEKETSHPKEPILYALIEALNVEPNYLFQDVIPISEDTVSSDEMERLVKRYRALDTYGKGNVDMILDRETKRCQEQAAQRAINPPVSMAQNVSSFGGYFPSFGFASAGTGALAQEEPLDWTYNEEPPKGATCTITIKGDSMEPRFHDGQVVWVDTRKMVEPGQIGVFIINGQAFCKKLVRNENGILFVSLNPRYEPIIPQEGDDIRLFGKVI